MEEVKQLGFPWRDFPLVGKISTNPPIIWKTYACRCRLTVMNENLGGWEGIKIPPTMADVPFWLKSHLGTAACEEV